MDRGQERHTGSPKPSPEELYRMWQDPQRWEEALDHLSPAQIRKGIHAVAKEEAAHPTRRRAGHASDSAPRIAPENVELDHRDHATSDRLRQEYLDDRPVPLRPRQSPEQEQSYQVDRQYQGDRQYQEPLYREQPGVVALPVDQRQSPPPQEPEFYGADLGLFKIGFTDDGSFNVGVNVGIARTDVKVGLENRVSAGVGMESLGADASVGVGINKKGLHSDVGVATNAFDQVGGHAGFDVNVGPETYVDGDVGGKVGPVHVRSSAGADVNNQGIGTRYGARTGLGDIFDVHTGGHVGVSRDSSAGAGVGAHLGQASFETGAAIDSDGNRLLRPNVSLSAGGRDSRGKLGVGAQLGPKLDAKVYSGYASKNLASGTNSQHEVALHAGQSGIGLSSQQDRNGRLTGSEFGTGDLF